TQQMAEDRMEEQQGVLHSLEIRPSYTWNRSPLLTEKLSLDSSLFPDTTMRDEERRLLIDKYPGIETVQYQPPESIPSAARRMNKYQAKQDMSLKRLQYLISGVFRPLDVLGLELSLETQNQNVQRYLEMLSDCRSLLLNVSANVNDLRNKIAFQAINPSFTTTNASSTNYTMSPAQFQEAITQQTTSSQAMKSASNLRNKKRQFSNTNNSNTMWSNNNNNQQYQQQPQQFFRPAPSSQQGGFLNNNNNNNHSNNNAMWSSRNSCGI
ncbi:uncharacterized protein EV154DRAFT_431167, partial [Mucor mucedo]|uniref:uncharacterized protein n=1 Tax=Mucor mucedo TaxID=29922 RepID=UPI00221FEC5D